MTHSRVGLACAVALLCAIGCSMPAAAPAAEVIVRRDPGLSAAQRADMRADAGVKLARAMSVPDTEVVTVPDARADDALDALNADPDVRYALPNSWLRVAGAPPSDQMWRQWALENAPTVYGSLYPGGVADADTDAPDAWDQGVEGQTVTVAVVDQLVYGEHPDFGNRVEPGEDVTQADGCTAGAPSGQSDHGTAVAGVIAADGRGTGGVAGIAPAAHVLPFRAIDNCGGGRREWVLDALEKAAERAPIVSASFATDPGPADPELNQAFLEIFDRHPNTLFVVAAGNEGANVDDSSTKVYPCATQRPGPPAQREVSNLLCVGMSDYRDRPSCWSNVGPASVDLFAPGVSILTTVRGGHFPEQGSSMATPMVAGAAALLLSSDRTIGAAGLAERLVNEVDGKDAMVPISVSGGRLNAARAVAPGGAYGSGGGHPGLWVTCDRDHDGIRDDTRLDQCPDEPGPPALNGCPDADGDGVTDASDNCRLAANADQADSDADQVGNACDQAPRGDDPDGDGIPALDDRCPTEFGSAPDGCPVIVNPPTATPTPTPTATPRPKATPTPTVTPQAVTVTLSAKVSKCKKGKRCKKVAKVTVKLSRQGKVALKVERRVRKKGRLVWTRVGRQKSLTANTRGSSFNVRGKSAVRTSRYRVTATFAGKTKAVSFKV